MKRSTPTSEGRKAEKALRKAVKKVIEENRRLGLPVAVMRNGRPVLIPAEKATAPIQRYDALNERIKRHLEPFSPAICCKNDYRKGKRGRANL